MTSPTWPTWPRCCGLVVWEQVGHRLSIPGGFVRPSHELDKSWSDSSHEHMNIYCIMHIYILYMYTIYGFIWYHDRPMLPKMLASSEDSSPLRSPWLQELQEILEIIRRHTHSINVKEIGISNCLLGVKRGIHVYIYIYIYIYIYVHTQSYTYYIILSSLWF